jgi:hypothetical protein
MKRNGISIDWVAWCLLTAISMTAGCDNAGKPSAPVVPPKPAPEASFDIIMDTLKRRIQDVPVGFVAPTSGGHSRLVASNTVDFELVPPTKEGVPYRAIVTVTSRSRFSLQRPIGGGDKQPKVEDQGRSNSLDDPSGLAAGVDIAEPGLAAAPSGGGERRDRPEATGTDVVRYVDPEVVKKYDLEYKGGRWALLTKPDPETERSIQSAFDEALATQI